MTEGLHPTFCMQISGITARWVPRISLHAQAPGAEKILYGLDDVRDSGEIIVVEGEMDKLALEEAGITNVVSVPDGAPSRVKEGDLPSPEEDTKYLYLWNCRAVLDQAVRIVLATDSDLPGQVQPQSCLHFHCTA